MQIKLSKALTLMLEAARVNMGGSSVGYAVVDKLLLTMLDQVNCHANYIVSKLLKEWEIDSIRKRIEKELVEKAAYGQPQVLEKDFVEYVGQAIASACGRMNPMPAIANTGHMLMAIVADRRMISARVMESYGVTPEKIIEYITQLPGEEDYYEELRALERYAIRKQQESSAMSNGELGEYEDIDDEYGDQVVKRKRSKKTISELEKYGVNLTAAAALGQIDPVIGREEEIERLIQILGRRKKNNPILIGEAGVGKSAVVEGLALRIASKEVPLSLRGKIIFSLDLASLVAGTKYRGQFEERIKSIIDQLSKSPEIIMFIDEIHTIVGAGSSQGSLDTANILKPALARGTLQCIGATTLDEYRESIENDSALERRFQKIIIEPTTPEQTLQILGNIKEKYERHHMVTYTDEALRACVDLTGRYITDRHFPDKAIDAMDEAGSKAHMFNVKEPDMVLSLESKIEKIGARKRKAIEDQDYETAADIRVKELALKSKLTESRSQWRREQSLNPFVITDEHIAQVITTMTGIPVDRVSQGERTRLLDMKQHLEDRIIGQQSAVSKIARSLQRSRAGLKDPDKPIGVFMFVGPTGVGKTHLAKELSKWMFDKSDSLIRIDMSEYSEKHNVSRLIGSPPGYVGYGEGGQLTEAVRRQPYAVVLFDEIEKAHPDVFNIMLQIFDDGQLTDGLGRKVDFRNTIIIMTSNVGSRKMAQKPAALGYSTSNRKHIEHVNREGGYRHSLEDTFAPEFINRIDDIVVFNTLSNEDILHIVDLELTYLQERSRSLGYKIKITNPAREALAELGYEPRYGVRSLKRTILDRVEEPLAQMIVGGEIESGDVVQVVKKRGEIEVLKKAM